jgi:hypothetical protein
LRTHASLTLVPPVFGDFLGGFVQPILVSCQPDYLDRCKPLGRVGCRITERCQLAQGWRTTDTLIDVVTYAKKKLVPLARNFRFGLETGFAIP